MSESAIVRTRTKKHTERELMRKERSQKAKASRPKAVDHDPPETLRRDHALETIRDMMLTGVAGFRSGNVLSENLLSERLGLTKAPIRQALSQLAGEGLLTVIPRIGSQVVVVGHQEAQAIMALRIAIESIIVGELARTRCDLGPLELIHNEMEKIAEGRLAQDANSTVAFVKADMAFHAKMAELAVGYGAASRTLNDLTSQFMLYVCRAVEQAEPADIMKETIQEHRHILDALKHGQPEDAIAHLQDHLRAAVDRLAPFAADFVRKDLRKYIRVSSKKAKNQ